MCGRQAASSRCSAKTSKANGNTAAHGIGHVAPPRVRKADPVADRGGLRDAAPDVADGQTAKQHVVGAENEEGVTLVLAQFALILAQAAAKGRTRQLVAGPLRLPADQMLAAHARAIAPTPHSPSWPDDANRRPCRGLRFPHRWPLRLARTPCLPLRTAPSVLHLNFVRA